MIKKILLFGVSVVMVSTPALAAADAFPEVTLPMLLSRTAFMQAESAGMGIACSMMTSTKSARVGETFVVAWGSYGATDPSRSAKSAWAPSGLQIIRVDVPGKYEYKLQFAGPSGVATCLSFVTVSAR